MAKRRLMTQAEYARHCGIDRAAVCRAVQSGRCPTVDGRFIDVAVADRDWRANILPTLGKRRG